MKFLSGGVAVVTFLAELCLAIYYFFALVPSYNKHRFVKPTLSDGDSPTCSLFITQSEAQEFYVLYKYSISDSKQLDNDKDGLVCENLP